MSSFTAARCRHIKVNGTQCGSPALRSKNFCFYHQKDRPWPVECYSDIEYATGEITLPFFEDAHSVQAVIRQVVQMVLQKRIERKTASLLLYALQIASSNLKRMELEKPQPEQVVTDLEPVLDPHEAWQAPIARSSETAGETSASAPPTNQDQKVGEVNASPGEDLPPGTIQACYRPGPKTQNRPRQSPPRRKQYVI
jgi:hypothetical protein